jgi:hypothetical protein
MLSGTCVAKHASAGVVKRKYHLSFFADYVYVGIIYT